MNPKKLPFVVIISLTLGVVLIWLSPEDRALGSLLKLVYLHSALITAGLSLFTAAGLVSLISLLRRSSGFFLLFAIDNFNSDRALD
jgi:hypothetical protein